jgi:hypothetical protein
LCLSMLLLFYWQALSVEAIDSSLLPTIMPTIIVSCN